MLPIKHIDLQCNSKLTLNSERQRERKVRHRQANSLIGISLEHLNSFLISKGFHQLARVKMALDAIG